MPLRWQRTISTADDRGGTCRLEPLIDPYGGVPVADPRMSRLRSRVRPILGAAIGPTIFVAVFGFMLLSGALNAWLSLPRPQGFAVQAACAALAGAAGVIVVRRRMLAMAQRIAAEYLREGVCPGCAYNLFGLAPQEDGCMECPECGAAWRAERVGTARPFDESARPSVLDHHRELLGPRRLLDQRSGRDDRDSRVELVTARHLHRIQSDDPGHQARARSAAAKIARSGRLLRWGAAGFFGLLSVAFPLLTLTFGPGPWLSRTLLVVLFGTAIMLLFAVQVARSELGVTARAIVAAAHDARLCASCGADLAAAAASGDGCTPCPRCDAAWRLPPRRI